MTVADMLDHLPVGRFHAFHLLRMILAWAIFSTAQESTPYMFPGGDSLPHGPCSFVLGGLRKSFQADEDSIATRSGSLEQLAAGGDLCSQLPSGLRGRCHPGGEAVGPLGPPGHADRCAASGLDTQHLDGSEPQRAGALKGLPWARWLEVLTALRTVQAFAFSVAITGM